MYEAPSITEIGSIAEMTKATGRDTATDTFFSNSNPGGVSLFGSEDVDLRP